MLARGALVLAAVLALVPVAEAKVQRDTKTIGFGAFMEQDVPLPGGATVPWNITLQPAGIAATYNIHSHDPSTGAVADHEQGLVVGGKNGTFRAPGAGTFSWMVTNINQTNLTVTIETTVADSAGTPDAGVLGGALALAAAAAVARRRR